MLGGAFAAVAASAAATSWQAGSPLRAQSGRYSGLAFLDDHSIGGRSDHRRARLESGRPRFPQMLPVRRGRDVSSGVGGGLTTDRPAPSATCRSGADPVAANPLTYVSWLTIPVIAFVLYRTAWGIALRPPARTRRHRAAGAGPTLAGCFDGRRRSALRPRRRAPWRWGCDTVQQEHDRRSRFHRPRRCLLRCRSALADGGGGIPVRHLRSGLLPLRQRQVGAPARPDASLPRGRHQPDAGCPQTPLGRAVAPPVVPI